MTAERPPEYVAIGHFTIDRTPLGNTLGGTVLYSAITAARFGARAAILTRGNLDRLDSNLRSELDAISSEVELVIQSGDDMTRFSNSYGAGRRTQAIHSWAGEVDLNGLPPLWRSAEIIHLAPVAQEFDLRGIGRLSPDFLGATPQGWMRRWNERTGGRVELVPLRLPSVAVSRLDAMVVSTDEYTQAREAYEAIGRQGMAVVTRGRQGASVLDRGKSMEIQGYPAQQMVDTTGAGDVFAAALFLMRGRHEPVLSSLRHAAAAAALSVSGHGLAAIPTLETVEELIAIERSRP